MAVFETFARSCRRERAVALAAVGVSFWVLLTASLLIGHAAGLVLVGPPAGSVLGIPAAP